MADEDDAIDSAALARLERLGGKTLLRQMIALFLENAPQRLNAATQGAAAGDARGVERAAHSVKSMAANVGARRLQRLAEALEAGIAGGMVDDLATRTRELVDEMERVRNRLEHHAGGP